MMAYRYDASGLYIDDLKRFLREDELDRPFGGALETPWHPENETSLTDEPAQEISDEAADVLHVHAYFADGETVEEGIEKPDIVRRRDEIEEIETLARASKDFIMTNDQEKLREIEKMVVKLREQLA